MEDIKSRLSQIAESKGLSIRAFEEFCNLKRGNISNILPGGAIGSDKLAKIFDAIPDINPTWLICGVGEMLTTSTPNKHNDEEIITLRAKNEELRDQLSEARGTISKKDKELGKCEAYAETIDQLRADLEQAQATIRELTATKNAATHSHAPTTVPAAP